MAGRAHATSEAERRPDIASVRRLLAEQYGVRGPEEIRLTLLQERARKRIYLDQSHDGSHIGHWNRRCGFHLGSGSVRNR